MQGDTRPIGADDLARRCVAEEPDGWSAKPEGDVEQAGIIADEQCAARNERRDLGQRGGSDEIDDSRRGKMRCQLLSDVPFRSGPEQQDRTVVSSQEAGEQLRIARDIPLETRFPRGAGVQGDQRRQSVDRMSQERIQSGAFRLRYADANLVHAGCDAQCAKEIEILMQDGFVRGQWNSDVVGKAGAGVVEADPDRRAEQKCQHSMLEHALSSGWVDDEIESLVSDLPCEGELRCERAMVLGGVVAEGSRKDGGVRQESEDGGVEGRKGAQLGGRKRRLERFEERKNPNDVPDPAGLEDEDAARRAELMQWFGWAGQRCADSGDGFECDVFDGAAQHGARRVV